MDSRQFDKFCREAGYMDSKLGPLMIESVIQTDVGQERGTAMYYYCLNVTCCWYLAQVDVHFMLNRFDQ